MTSDNEISHLFYTATSSMVNYTPILFTIKQC